MEGCVFPVLLEEDGIVFVLEGFGGESYKGVVGVGLFGTIGVCGREEVACSIVGVVGGVACGVLDACQFPEAAVGCVRCVSVGGCCACEVGGCVVGKMVWGGVVDA